MDFPIVTVGGVTFDTRAWLDAGGHLDPETGLPPFAAALAAAANAAPEQAIQALRDRNPARDWSVADGPEIVVATMPAAGRVAAVALTLDAGLDDPAATLALGTRADPDLYLAAGSFAVGAPSVVLDWPGRPLAAGTEIILTIGGAPSSGGGRVRLELDTES